LNGWRTSRISQLRISHRASGEGYRHDAWVTRRTIEVDTVAAIFVAPIGRIDASRSLHESSSASTIAAKDTPDLTM
jgi:hypothetical protein